MSNRFIIDELRSLALGERLGEGSAREVYQLLLNAQFVIKLERKSQSFQNICEWETWRYVQGTPMEPWFCPCEKISNGGSMLIQWKCEPLQQSQLPKKLPWYMRDLKKENFGMFKNRVVVFDYGTLHSVIGSSSNRMVKAEWRS